ncbi:hypothetical protein EVAR_45753_1 [Eumeta japonica]|uniref:Uncharacterized protein n=1 Tax=Eumeta variegata TaxID=151549 RepID=A0A4C1YNA6_EUMVA|nr:hypothetical protein EVAR_45753_1 [Eumeta japonica]
MRNEYATVAWSSALCARPKPERAFVSRACERERGTSVRERDTIGLSVRLVTHLSLFHSIGRCVREEKRQRPHTTYT